MAGQYTANFVQPSNFTSFLFKKCPLIIHDRSGYIEFPKGLMLQKIPKNIGLTVRHKHIMSCQIFYNNENFTCSFEKTIGIWIFSCQTQSISFFGPLNWSAINLILELKNRNPWLYNLRVTTSGLFQRGFHTFKQ